MNAHEPTLRLTRLGRLSRSVLVAGVSTLLALFSHVAAGGPMPEVQGVLVPLGLAVIVCLPLSGRLRSLPRLAAAVGLSQLLYHWLFVLGTGAGTLVAVEGAGPHAGHAGHAFLLTGGMTAASADAVMWAAHGLAAVATIALIRHGELALLGVQRLLTLIARAILRTIPAHSPIETVAPRSTATAPRPAPSLRLLAEAVTRRGPPRGRLAIAI